MIIIIIIIIIILILVLVLVLVLILVLVLVLVLLVMVLVLVLVLVLVVIRESQKRQKIKISKNRPGTSGNLRGGLPALPKIFKNLGKKLASALYWVGIWPSDAFLSVYELLVFLKIFLWKLCCCLLLCFIFIKLSDVSHQNWIIGIL